VVPASLIRPSRHTRSCISHSEAGDRPGAEVVRQGTPRTRVGSKNS